jgi:ribosomal protein S8
MKSKVAQLLDRYGYIQDEQATEFNVRRSASVDLPWSICAIIAKLRMKAASMRVW